MNSIDQILDSCIFLIKNLIFIKDQNLVNHLSHFFVNLIYYF